MEREFAFQRSWVEIDIKQLLENCQFIKEYLGEEVQIMAVVKADAYGHGDVQVSKCLEQAGISLFAVANLEEALRIRKAGIKGEILILGYTPPAFADELSVNNITQTILSEEYADQLFSYGKKTLKCQVAVGTGMSRIGLNAVDVASCERIIRRVAQSRNLCGIFTHLCVADSQNPENIEFTKRQMGKFTKVSESVADLQLPYIHYLNSAGALFYSDSESKNKIVRLVLYGLKPDYELKLPVSIKPVLSWKSVISMVKEVQPGESIGYGRSLIANKTMKLATIPIGYADGYSRLLSIKGHVLIKGKRAPILGKICMFK